MKRLLVELQLLRPPVDLISFFLNSNSKYSDLQQSLSLRRAARALEVNAT